MKKMKPEDPGIHLRSASPEGEFRFWRQSKTVGKNQGNVSKAAVEGWPGTKLVWATIRVLWVVLVFAGPAAGGEVYTWTDADGNIHITDRPPGDSSQVESVIRFSNPPKPVPPPDPEPPQNNLETKQIEQLNKKLARLKERKSEIQAMLADNQTSIDAARKDARRFSRGSGTNAIRNAKVIQRQLMVLKNNQITYQSDLRFVDEDIAEVERLLEASWLDTKRQGGQSDGSAPPN